MHTKRFGEMQWGPKCMVPAPTPVGKTCGHCGEKVAEGDNGVLIPTPAMLYDPNDEIGLTEQTPPEDAKVGKVVFSVQLPRPKPTVVETPIHRECFLRKVYGSVGHQMGQCPCRGGNTEDPEGMTKRQAAWAAVEYMERVGPFQSAIKA